MDDAIAQDIATALETLCIRLEKQNELQDEANGLMRSLIPALETNAQELLELRTHLEFSEDK